MSENRYHIINKDGNIVASGTFNECNDYKQKIQKINRLKSKNLRLIEIKPKQQKQTILTKIINYFKF